MAVPLKPNIATKTDYAVRPSIPSAQKQNATEFNLLVSAVRANYERLILDWTTDVLVNTTFEVGQYVLYLGGVYKITVSYNVGSPLTWNGANAVLVISSSSDARGDHAGTTAFPSTGGTYTAGAPARGNRWRLTDTLVVDGKVYSPGSVVEAAIDDANPADSDDWIVYAVQAG